MLMDLLIFAACQVVGLLVISPILVLEMEGLRSRS